MQWEVVVVKGEDGEKRKELGARNEGAVAPDRGYPIYPRQGTASLIRSFVLRVSTVTLAYNFTCVGYTRGRIFES